MMSILEPNNCGTASDEEGKTFLRLCSDVTKATFPTRSLAYLMEISAVWLG